MTVVRFYNRSKTGAEQSTNPEPVLAELTESGILVI